MNEQLQNETTEFVDVPVDSYFRIIRTDVDVSPFAERLRANPDDWSYVGIWSTADAARTAPYGIIPMIMAPIPEFGSNVHINDVELLYNTAYYEKYKEIVTWLEDQNYQPLARSAFLTLGPGNATEINRNTGKYNETRDRYCLVIQGTGLFTIHGQEFEVEAGTLFWFDQTDLHADMNIGEDDKWTFVFDVPRVEEPPQDVPPPQDYRGESGEEAVS